jgi:hypothetical protein
LACIATGAPELFDPTALLVRLLRRVGGILQPGKVNVTLEKEGNNTEGD